MQNKRILGLGLVAALMVCNAQAKARDNGPQPISGHALCSQMWDGPVVKHRGGATVAVFATHPVKNILGQRQYKADPTRVPGYWSRSAQHSFNEEEVVLIPTYVGNECADLVFGVVIGRKGNEYLVQIGMDHEHHVSHHRNMTETRKGSEIYKFNLSKYKKFCERGGKACIGASFNGSNDEDMEDDSDNE